MRNPTEYELKILEAMLKHMAHGADQLNEQLKHAQVSSIDEEGSLRFKINSPVVTDIEDRVPITGIFDDADGIPIYLLLHIVDGRLAELEIYKADGSKILNKPVPEKLYF